MSNLEATYAAAKEEAARIKKLVKDEIDAATKAINAKYAAELDAATTAEYKAHQAVEDAKFVAATTHPLVGKKVSRMGRKKIGGSKWNPRYADVTVNGIVEVADYGTAYPGNIARWRLPERGSVFIRLLRADGTPGLAYEEMTAAWTEAQ